MNEKQRKTYIFANAHIHTHTHTHNFPSKVSINNRILKDWRVGEAILPLI